MNLTLLHTLLLLLATLATGLLCVPSSLRHTTKGRSPACAAFGAGKDHVDRDIMVPKKISESFSRDASHVMKAGISTGLITCVGQRPADAIGTLYELKDTVCTIQDISFNVPDANEDTVMFKALFQDTCSPVRQEIVDGQQLSSLSFGPDGYEKPQSFLYGVSTFADYGGHFTLTLRSETNPNSNVVDAGNGLKYVKVGAELLRISNGIQAGAQVEGAYGWIDVISPGGVPLEVVVGIARDPFMFASLSVQNMKESLAFFCDEMGMTQMPMPLARQKGSQYEPQQPKESIFLSYGEDLFGLLLQQAPRRTKVNPGGLLGEITVLADDSPLAVGQLPSAVKAALKGGNGVVRSPDGYTFVVKGFSKYKFSS
jgi:hypothetical protein